MLSIASVPGARRLFTLSIAARVPLAMLSIALLVHTEHVTGSFAAAGLVTGAYAVAVGVGGPLLGRLVDDQGQTRVLLVSAAAAAALLAAIALAPAGVPLPLLVALAGGIGLATPPVGACLRTLLPQMLPDPRAVRAAFALESSATEITWVAGPPLALGLGALLSTAAALLAAGIVMLVATAAFAADPRSRAWRPAPAGARPRGGSLGTPAMRTLVLTLLPVGVLFGAVEVAVTAASDALEAASAAGPLLGIWGVGSLAGGLVTARLGGGARTATGLALVLAVLAAGHLALAGATGSLPAIGALLALGGAAIAPTFAAVYAMVDEAAPAGTVTEAFAWLATATAIGAALGTAVGGALAEGHGAGTAFALAGGAGAVATITVLLRGRTLGAPCLVAATTPA